MMAVGSVSNKACTVKSAVCSVLLLAELVIKSVMIINLKHKSRDIIYFAYYKQIPLKRPKQLGWFPP